MKQQVEYMIVVMLVGSAVVLIQYISRKCATRGKRSEHQLLTTPLSYYLLSFIESCCQLLKFQKSGACSSVPRYHGTG